MSVKSFDDLVAAGQNDATLAAALNQARTVADLVALGAKSGFAFDEEAARAGLLRHRSRDLDDSELDGVAGGRKAGGEQQEYFKITLKDVLISG